MSSKTIIKSTDKFKDNSPELCILDDPESIQATMEPHITNAIMQQLVQSEDEIFKAVRCYMIQNDND